MVPGKPLNCLCGITDSKTRKYRNYQFDKFLAVSAVSAGAIGERGSGVFERVSRMYMESVDDPTAGGSTEIFMEWSTSVSCGGRGTRRGHFHIQGRALAYWPRKKLSHWPPQ